MHVLGKNSASDIAVNALDTHQHVHLLMNLEDTVEALEKAQGDRKATYLSHS